jgi:peroxiredoxin
MKKTSLNLILFTIAAGLLLCPAQAQAQMPVIVGQPMPNFTLRSVQGGEVTLSSLKGKIVLLVFPRGRVGDDWCQICHYQYAELVELEEQLGLREKYNMEILFVLPYSQEMVKEWTQIFPEQMAVIEGWKHPPDDENLTEGRRRWAELARRYFSKTFTYDDGVIPLPFPVLVDADRAVSNRLMLFRTSWDGSDVEQNIPTIFILDGNGIVQFKYHSQTTFDRPSPEYLATLIDRLLAGE